VTNRFFEAPILNSPYEYPGRLWELDENGQPTQKVIESRRRAEFITPIPKPKKQKGKAKQAEIVFDEGEGLSTQEQQYAHTAILNGVREHVDKWRRLPNPNDWHVTPETARLLQHWRHHRCLFDEGCVIISPDLRFVVSRRVREEFENGREYYRLDGKLFDLSDLCDYHPSAELVCWHNDERFE